MIANKIKRFDIWCEGYVATGQRATATCLAQNIEGYNFEDACIQWYCSLSKIEQERQGQLRYYNGHMQIWGCNLYDNEADARKNFG